MEDTFTYSYGRNTDNAGPGCGHPVQTADSTGKTLHRTIAVTITVVDPHVGTVEKVTKNNNKLNDKHVIGLSEAPMFASYYSDIYIYIYIYIRIRLAKYIIEVLKQSFKCILIYISF